MEFLVDGKIKTHKVYQKLIQERIEILNSNPDQECRNIIDAFITEREKRKTNNNPSQDLYSDKQFYHLLADIFGASLDTTLTTLRWFFLFMAIYPYEQEKIQKELDSVLNGRQPSLDDLPNLPVTKAALAETQRIRSVVPVGIPHGTLDDTTIEGFHVPKGTMVVPLQWAVHMDPKYWINPNIYDPSRFLEHGKFVKRDYFIPFQTGKFQLFLRDVNKMIYYFYYKIYNYIKCT